MRSGFAAVTFLGAFLLFLIQPLVARQVLPWFGGAQSVWTVSLVFYQTLLLAGYLYAHVGRRLGPRRQALLHVALLTMSLVLLPVTASGGWKPTGGADPTWRLLGLLAATVGGPYLLLAGTAPLLHDWFGRLHPGRSPYPLYALSNVGSLLALLAYPILVERLLPVSRQSVLWSAAYAVFTLACAALTVGMARSAATACMGVAGERVAPTRADLSLWLALSACGSGLLLALTSHITLDVAPVPLLWVLPLAVYLLTYVLAFVGWYRRATWGACLVLGLGAMCILWAGGFALPFGVQMATSVAVLFVACMVCHGELARSAPPPSYLTTFYLTLAAGGALGGVLVALVAPAVLPDVWELPALLLLSYALLLVILHRERGSRRRGGRGLVRWAALTSVLMLAIAGFVLPTVRRDQGTVARARGFYGVLRVQDAPAGVMREQRVLRVGRILHGGEFLDPARAGEATAYFTAGSGVERAIRAHPRRRAGQPVRIGVIGLGVGTLAAWGEAGDSIRFYELNPEVEALARRYFTFLDKSRAAVSVVLGDGRLSLERELADPSARGRFDVLVIDAFTGDAVPVHLLTRESALLYQSALAEGGVLAFNVTNRHVDLAPVVRGLAATLGRPAVEIAFAPPPGSGGTPSRWVIVTADSSLIESLGAGSALPRSEHLVVWTDEFSSLFGVLR